MMMDDEDKNKISATDIEAVATIPAPASAATVASKDLLGLKLNLSAKELKWFQDMIASEVGMEHLLQAAAQEDIDMPVPRPLGEVTAVQPKFPIDGLVLLAVNTTTDSGDKDDGKVNKECLRYDLGKFPLKPGSHDGLWSKETCMLSQARMAAYTSDSPTVFALQCGFCPAWLQVLGLKKDMSLVSDDMSQPTELDNGSTLPPYTGPSDNVFPDDATFGYQHMTCCLLLKGCGQSFLT